MFNAIENDTKIYLKQVLKTVFIGLFWMFANVIIGIFYEFGFVDNSLSIGNIVYFILAFISLVFLILYFIKLWRKPKIKN